MIRPAFRILLALALLAGFGLSGCGRKGKLEPPPKEGVTQQDGNGQHKPDPGIQRPHRKLFIDKILN